jgi:hypothetical protein
MLIMQSALQMRANAEVIFVPVDVALFNNLKRIARDRYGATPIPMLAFQPFLITPGVDFATNAMVILWADHSVPREWTCAKFLEIITT